jgi:glycine cleavage system pyridoxal-binding protein P
MSYGPHTTEDRARMLAKIGVDSVDALFADIPASLRASELELPPPSRRPSCPFGCRLWPAPTAST